MQLSPRACTGGFPTLSGHLINIAFDQGFASEDGLDGMLHLSEEAPQFLTEAAERPPVLSYLHANYIYSIQKQHMSRTKMIGLKKNVDQEVTESTTGGKILPLFLTV